LPELLVAILSLKLLEGAGVDIFGAVDFSGSTKILDISGLDELEDLDELELPPLELLLRLLLLLLLDLLELEDLEREILPVVLPVILLNGELELEGVLILLEELEEGLLVNILLE